MRLLKKGSKRHKSDASSRVTFPGYPRNSCFPSEAKGTELEVSDILKKLLRN